MDSQVREALSRRHLQAERGADKYPLEFKKTLDTTAKTDCTVLKTQRLFLFKLSASTLVSVHIGHFLEYLFILG